MIEALDRRVREMRGRVLVRSWEYRQRNGAHGVWGRLRRVLSNAGAAFVIPPEAAEELAAEGYKPEPVGLEFDPPKTILFVPAARLDRVPIMRTIPVRLDAAFLGAAHVALLPLDAND